MPRLTLQDMKDLRRAVTNLLAADETLKRSSWASAPAVHELVMSAVMVIGPLHDRAEPTYLRILEELGPQTLQERSEAASAADHSTQDPESGPDEPEG